MRNRCRPNSKKTATVPWQAGHVTDDDVLARCTAGVRTFRMDRFLKAWQEHRRSERAYAPPIRLAFVAAGCERALELGIATRTQEFRDLTSDIGAEVATGYLLGRNLLGTLSAELGYYDPVPDLQEEEQRCRTTADELLERAAAFTEGLMLNLEARSGQIARLFYSLHHDGFVDARSKSLSREEAYRVSRQATDQGIRLALAEESLFGAEQSATGRAWHRRR